MMEQVYGTTEDQIREVKSIARRFLGKTQNYQGFSQSFKTSVEEQVNKKVLGLLQEQKPKVLVYGIYNAGKSTLVNVLCGKEVAEVGDRPFVFRGLSHKEAAPKYKARLLRRVGLWRII